MAVEENEGIDTTVDPPTRGMIDISDKPVSQRVAVATGTIHLNSESMLHILNKTNPKGDVLENAKLAAIHAVKQTPNLVFMCHPIQIRLVKVDFEIKENSIVIEVQVKTEDKTGVEIEAVAGVMNGLLAIFDLCKRYEKDLDGQYQKARIDDIKVIHKHKEELL